MKELVISDLVMSEISLLFSPHSKVNQKDLVSSQNLDTINTVLCPVDVEYGHAEQGVNTCFKMTNKE